MTGRVITSYSIHYTKLYDQVDRLGIKLRPQSLGHLLDLDHQRLQLAVHPAQLAVTLDLHITGQRRIRPATLALGQVRQQPARHQQAANQQQNPIVFLEKIRITSYNVCYTKLLRSAFQKFRQSFTGDGYGGGNIFTVAG